MMKASSRAAALEISLAPAHFSVVEIKVEIKTNPGHNKRLMVPDFMLPAIHLRVSLICHAAIGVGRQETDEVQLIQILYA